MSRVTCHMYFFFIYFLKQIVGASWWRVFNQRGRPRLVLVSNSRIWILSVIGLYLWHIASALSMWKFWMIDLFVVPNWSRSLIAGGMILFFICSMLVVGRIFWVNSATTTYSNGREITALLFVHVTPWHPAIPISVRLIMIHLPKSEQQNLLIASLLSRCSRGCSTKSLVIHSGILFLQIFRTAWIPNR